MLIQASALGLLAASNGSVAIAVVAATALGTGTALVYPTLIASISDSVSPVARATTVGVYRFWRDMGYVVGGLLVGLLADAIDPAATIAAVAILTALSGLWAWAELPGAPRRASLRRPARPSRPSRA
jgi:MFS family permease